MPYILSFERKAERTKRKAKRKAELKVELKAELKAKLKLHQAHQEAVLEILQIRFENLPSSLELMINQIEDDSVLKALHSQAVMIASLEEFQQQVAQLVSVAPPEE